MKGWSTTGPPRYSQSPGRGWEIVQQLVLKDSGAADDSAVIRPKLSGVGSGSVGDKSLDKLIVPGRSSGSVDDLATLAKITEQARDSAVADSLAKIGLVAPGSGAGDDYSTAKPSILARDGGAGDDVLTFSKLSTPAAKTDGALSGTGTANFKADPGAPWAINWTSVTTYTFTIPVWTSYIDVVLLGGGASGQTGSGAVGTAGKGGTAGQWYAVRLTRGVDIPWTLITFTVTVGAGGAQAANSDLASPNAGGNSSAVINGVTYTATGGQTTTSTQNGASPGNYTFQGITYTGGTGGTGNAGAPTAPGAAGAGGNGGIFGSRTRGAAGAAGAAWLMVY